MTQKKYKLDQVAIRMVREKPLYSSEPINSPEKAVKVLSEAIKDYDREVVCVVNLNSALQPINLNICSMGAIDRAIVCPREILKSSILSNATSVMLIHNHPSGNPQPSEQDVIVTDRMQEVYKLMDIKLLDHVIIGNEQYYSFTENRIMPESQLSFTSIMELYQLKHGLEAQREEIIGKTVGVETSVSQETTTKESEVQERRLEYSRMNPQEEKDVLAEKVTALELAARLDQWYQDYDLYAYQDSVDNTEQNIKEIAESIESGQTNDFKKLLNTALEEDHSDSDTLSEAKELLNALEDYKPLAKAEEIEEQNYNMIDNRINNVEPKEEREPQKKEQKRISAKEKYPDAKYSHLRIEKRVDDEKYNLIADVQHRDGTVEKDKLIGEFESKEKIVEYCKKYDIAYDDITNYLQNKINHKKKVINKKREAARAADTPGLGKKGKGVGIDD